MASVALRVNLSAGFLATQRASAHGWTALATTVEALGYDTLQVADHLRPGGAAPFSALAAAATATECLRVGTYVLNNDFRHPVLLAHEAAALAELSNARFTLGLGAGHMRAEYDEAGLRFDPAHVRVQRMAESASILRRLLAGETVDHQGEHYTIRNHAVREPGGPGVRLLIGGNGNGVLRAAARLADVVGFTGFTPSADGAASNITHFTDVGLAERITFVRQAAGERWPLQLDVLVQSVIITDRVEDALDRMSARLKIPVEAVRASPFVLVGSAAAIADRLGELHERLGITSVTVFANRPHSDQTEHTMAPVIEALG